MPPFDSILETIGNTPIVRINKLAPDHVNLFAKIEAFNPMGSVKDRLALGVIEDAEKSGALSPGQTVVEATSGNTGIGLAMVCAVKGYPLVVTMAESFSVERRRLMRFLGAKVVLTPASEKGTGMYRKAEELADAHGWFLARQFENPANPDMHARTTAREILETFDGIHLDYWVTGAGTGGTLQGIARVLRAESPNTKIIVCEPDNAQILGGGHRTKYNSDGAPLDSHPDFRPHLMQGWTPDFIPKITGDAMDEKLIDRFLPVNGLEALRLAKALACKEGIFAGISGGATFAAAVEIAKTAPNGANILCMLPDTGERYLSTPLFEDIPADMTDAEIALSKSTPGYRFDQAPKTAPQSADAAPVDVNDRARQFVAGALADREQPVAFFALEWCEFCWSVRKMFAELDIDYRAIDLDSVEYQENGWGGEIRKALEAQTAMKTIPQIFVGGSFIGGCSEVFDSYKDGRLQKLFDEFGVSYADKAGFDPYELLPKWLHPR